MQLREHCGIIIAQELILNNNRKKIKSFLYNYMFSLYLVILR